jgi:hypothetical protein
VRLHVVALAESPLRWEQLPRLRPTAGLAYEKHDWAPELFEGIPGLALRHRGRPGTYSVTQVDRVALTGTGLAPLVANLFGAHSGVLLTEGAALALSSAELLCQGADALLEHPRSLLVAPPPARFLYACLRDFPFYQKDLQLRRLLQLTSLIATALSGPVRGIAVYQTHGGGDLEAAVRRAAQQSGVAMEWMDGSEPVATDLGLPRLEELPVEQGDVLDLRGYNLAQLPEQSDAAELLLDDTAVVDLDSLKGWPRLQRLSLLKLQVRSLAPVRQLRRLIVECPTAALLRELAESPLEELVLHGGHLDDMRPLNGMPNLRVLELHQTSLGSLRGIEDLGFLERVVLASPEPPLLAPLAALTRLRSLAVQFRKGFDARLLPALPSLVELELSGFHGCPVALEHPAALASFPGLRSLDLTATDLKETSWLAALAGLRKLVLVATDFSVCPELAHLGALEHLDLSAGELSDLAPLEVLRGLTYLAVSSVPALERGLLPLSALGLRQLHARGAVLADLRGLSTFRELRELDLGAAHVASLRGVEALGHLESLDLSMGTVSDLKPLSHHQKLLTLKLNDTPIESIEVLSTLSLLREIDISHTNVQDITPLAHLSLQSVRLSKLKLDDLGPVASSSLESLDLSKAEVSTLQPLQGLPLQELVLNHARFGELPSLDLPHLRTLDLSLTPTQSFERLLSLPRLRELRAGWLLRRPDLTALLSLPPLARLELDRSYVRGAMAEALALRHHLVLQGE